MLCEYKNIFGNIKEGIHSYRVFNLAIFDIIFTIIGSYIIYLILKKKVNYFIILIIIFILGILLHKIFCVKTTINNIIF